MVLTAAVYSVRAWVDIEFVECWYGPGFNRMKRGRGVRVPQSRVKVLKHSKALTQTFFTHSQEQCTSSPVQCTLSHSGYGLKKYMLGHMLTNTRRTGKETSSDANRGTHPRCLVLLVMQRGAHDSNRVWCMISYRTKASHRDVWWRVGGGGCACPPVLFVGSHEVSISFATPCLVVQSP